MDERYLFRLQEYLIRAGYLIKDHKDISYGVQFHACKENVRELIRVYQNTKGKITLDLSQISDTDLKNNLAAFETTIITKTNKKTPGNYYIFAPPLIGTDEAGKGDYFGPLCAAAVYADKEQYSQLQAAGVKDSKQLNDTKIALLAKEIIKICPQHYIASVSNQTFNTLYKKTHNINAILGSLHGKAIRAVLSKINCRNILVDRFGKKQWVENQLKGYDVCLEQEPKAEQNTVVAAASILARNAFVEHIHNMSATYALRFPLGASAYVDTIGKEFVKKYGLEQLAEVAKISFKNTERIREK